MSASKSGRLFTTVLILVGLGSLTSYLYLLRFENLRDHIPAFERSFFLAFLLYTVAALVVLNLNAIRVRDLLLIFLFAASIQVALLFTKPSLSDDMYRYIWEGRVQSMGISPYEYAPSADELTSLRDTEIWPSINRKSAVTIYPPVAQELFLILWRIIPDEIWWFQACMALGGLLAGVLLVGLLRDLGLPSVRVLIYLWSPLFLFETAHSAHLDGFVLPLLAGAWWARARERDGMVGILLGLATGMKYYPAVLLPALWRPKDKRGRWLMPLAFLVVLSATYLPYIFQSGVRVLGYLPQYLGESFNVSPLVKGLMSILSQSGVNPRHGMLILTIVVLFTLTLWMIFKPASNGEQAIRRSIWMIGAITLLSQNLFPWYMLWLLPLIAVFLDPPYRWFNGHSFQVNAWTGWFLFCGLIALSYTFFIDWKVVQLSQWIQFLPLYAFLLIDVIRGVYSLLIRRGNTTIKHYPTGST